MNGASTRGSQNASMTGKAVARHHVARGGPFPFGCGKPRHTQATVQKFEVDVAAWPQPASPLLPLLPSTMPPPRIAAMSLAAQFGHMTLSASRPQCMGCHRAESAARLQC